MAPQRATVRGIELEDPNEAQLGPQQSQATRDPALVASGAEAPAGSSARDDDGFVYSRDPSSQPASANAQITIHLHESWWPFRAGHLGISVAQAQKRDRQISHDAAPPDFWDSQTALEAVSVWTLLCNECHGGRRSRQDAQDMPEPARAWGQGEGLFFGNRRSYSHMFDVVFNGGPVKEGGRAEMPAWRQILSAEMIWALLYFLEYQSGGVESRFPPSLFPRRPKAIGNP